MHLRIVTAFVLVAATATPSSAFDFPHRKAGMWSIAMNMDGVKMQMPSTTMCLDANTDAQLMQHSMQWQVKACDPPAIQGMGPVRTVDIVCHMNGGTQKTHMVMTFTGDSAYHMDMGVQYTPAQYGRAGMHMTQDAKWMGACPAGMKAGDMTVGGMTINVLNSGGMPQGHMTKAQIEAIIKAHQR